MSHSLWWEQLGETAKRPALAEHLSVDVAIVGAGFTGLWTAYWLLRLEPTLQVAILESQQVGFGASGRNGGWFSAIFPADLDHVARISNRTAAIELQRQLQDQIPEIEQLLQVEGIACDFARGGTVQAIRTAVQEQRATAEIDWWRSWGFGDSDIRLLDKAEATSHLAASQLRGATFTPHCARVQPLKLVRGLAAAVERRGGHIFEFTKVRTLAGKQLATESGFTVQANNVVLATEAYTSQLRGLKRKVAPVYSLMVATEPLSNSTWSEIGLQQNETFADYRHMIIYGQRTADNRIAFGGRGAPYHFGSAIDSKHEIHPPTHRMIWQELKELLPQLSTATLTHRWGGPLAIPRDWMPSVQVSSDGLAWAGGYVGDGLPGSALGGRTLAELLTSHRSERTELPWVGHQSRKWEIEPLRWLGVTGGLKVMQAADHEESITGKPSKLASTFNRILRK